MSPVPDRERKVSPSDSQSSAGGGIGAAAGGAARVSDSDRSNCISSDDVESRASGELRLRPPEEEAAPSSTKARGVAPPPPKDDMPTMIGFAATGLDDCSSDGDVDCQPVVYPRCAVI